VLVSTITLNGSDASGRNEEVSSAPSSVAIAVVASAIKNENMNDAILSFLACGKVMGLESDERAKNEYFSNG